MSFDNEASYLIDSVEVQNLWGKYNISSKLSKDVNIFIGINGSYKTTLIRLIYNLLTLDFEKLITVDFDFVKLKLRNGKSSKTIIFSKVNTENGEKKYLFEIKGIRKMTLTERDVRLSERFIFDDDDDDDFEPSFISYGNSKSVLKSKFVPLREEVTKIINIDYLNINRYSSNRRRHYFHDDEPYSIEYEIKKLVEQFIRYQSEIKTAINKCTNDFLLDSFIFLLKEDLERIDNYKLSFSSSDLEDYKKILKEVSKDEDFVAKELFDLKTRIDDIDSIMSKVAKENKSFSMSDLMRFLGKQDFAKLLGNFPFIAKFQKMLEKYKEAEKVKRNIEKPTKKFMDISNEFLKSKMFPEKSLVTIEDGSLMLKIDKDQTVPLRSLSSGEKQLIILLLRSLLQKGKKGVYIADEPELSLHIKWQEKLIRALREINPNIQIIFATHSPDIVSEFDNKLIQMEDILSNG